MSETPRGEGLPVDSSVLVQRSSGEIEEGWLVVHYFDWPEAWPGLPAGTPAVHVIKPETETSEQLSKDVSVDELLSWQPDPENDAFGS